MWCRTPVLTYALASVMVVEGSRTRARTRKGLMLGERLMVAGAGGCGRGDVRACGSFLCLVHNAFASRAMRADVGVDEGYAPLGAHASACIAAVDCYPWRYRL